MRGNISARTVLLFCVMALALEASRPHLTLADDSWAATRHPALQISRVAGPIKIDGELDDPGWRGAARAASFAEHTPGDQTQPPVETEAFMTYDDDNVYVAMICHDDPQTVRASFCERDRIFNDDCAFLLIDSYGDGAWAYELAVNPYGIQGDLLFSRDGGEDEKYNLVWKSAGRITDSGYQIEMAVPFASLRFPNNEQQIWKVDFWRNHPRDIRRQYSWAAYDRDEPCWPCQWGTVTGIEHVSPGKGIELLPSAIGYQSSALDGSRHFVNDDADGQLSLNAKYALGSNITAEATINPDFSQIESDAAQIDVNTTFALSYPERRPFFQEGSDLFLSPFTAIYTRSINDPQAAIKFIGRVNHTSIAYLAAYDEHSPITLPFEEHSEDIQAGKSLSNVLRARQTVGEDSYVGLVATDRRLDGGGSGSLTGIDGAIRFLKNYQFRWQALGTHTEEPNKPWMTPGLNDTQFDGGRHTAGFDGESFWGHAYHAGVLRSGRHLDYSVSYTERSPTFRADNGYEPSNNQRKINATTGCTVNLDRGLFTQFYPQLTMIRQWNFDGELKQQNVTLDLSGSTRLAQVNLHTQYFRGTQRFGGVDFDGIWNGHFCVNGRPSDLVAFGGGINYGHQIAWSWLVTGKEIRLTPWVDLKPMDRLLIESAFSYAKSNHLDNDERLYEQYIVRSRLSYQVTRALSVRLVVQYDDRKDWSDSSFTKTWEVDPLLTYRVNSFSVLYLGSTHNYEELAPSAGDPVDAKPDWALSSRQFFVKLQYLVQL
jgi:hypothetical protein